MKLTSILLDESITSDYTIIHPNADTTTEQDNALANLSKINIFIGANNSGKSRLMRTLFVNETFKYLRLGVRSDELVQQLKKYHDSIINRITNYVSSDVVSIPDLIEEKGYLNKEGETGILQKWFVADNYGHFTFNTLKKDNSRDLVSIRYDNIPSLNDHQLYFLDVSNKLKHENTKFCKTYIPILRGLRPIHIIKDKDENKETFEQGNNYFHRTILDYFEDEKEANKLSISTGLDFYEQLRNLKNGDVPEQKLVKEFESFLSETFFQNEDVVITAHARKDVVTFRVGDGDARPIYHIGDGIQAIILLTYPLFFNKCKDMIFFFEEPEIYLHPGFQRIFIDTLLSKRFERFQYFFTTHSNHFLDITLDHDNISIYNFRKEKGSANKFEIENVQSGDNSLLEELGVRNASVFLSNCTIWVEGITDRIYIRKYLDVLMKKDQNTEGSYFREDYHYSFVEYSGNNITHWSFLDNKDSNHVNINVDRICKRIFLVTDQDGAGELDEKNEETKKDKKERQIQLKKKLGEENYHCLECREIENALSVKILKAVFETRRDKRKSANKQMEKKEITYIRNWSYEDYQKEKLGDFIDGILSDDSREMLTTFNAAGGTINDKLDFAKSAVAAITSFDYLSQPAQKLTEKIYAFIKKSNE